MARRTKVSDAKTPEEFRGAVAGRWKKIYSPSPPAPTEEELERRAAAERRASRPARGGGSGFGGLGGFEREQDPDSDD